jgi:hypothetical protein
MNFFLNDVVINVKKKFDAIWNANNNILTIYHVFFSYIFNAQQFLLFFLNFRMIMFISWEYQNQPD